MFVRQVKGTSTEFHQLKANDSIAITLPGLKEVLVSVDFIAQGHSASHIFVKMNSNQRGILKVWGQRSVLELVVYEENSVKVQKVEKVEVTKRSTRWAVDFQFFDVKLGRYVERYEAETTGYKPVPVVIGDKFVKGGKNFTVSAIAGNLETMFLESESGEGLVVNHNDTSLIYAFGGDFTWA